MKLIAEQEKHFPIRCEMHLHTSHSDQEEEDDEVVSWRAVYFNKGTEIRLPFSTLYKADPIIFSVACAPQTCFFNNGLVFFIGFIGVSFEHLILEGRQARLCFGIPV